MWTYRISGLSVLSEIDIPGAMPYKGSEGTEVYVRVGPVPKLISGEQTTSTRWVSRGSTFLFEVPHVARFMIAAGREITVQISDWDKIQDASLYLLGSVFAVVLYQRRDPILHGSAVAFRGNAAVFCGPSGSGKSTLAAALLEHGCSFMNDDFCRIAFSPNGSPILFPDGRMIKLWEDSVISLSLSSQKTARVDKDSGKYFVRPSSKQILGGRPITSIYILSEARSFCDLRVRRIIGVEAAAHLRANAYKPEIISAMNMESKIFNTIASLISSAAIYMIERPSKMATSYVDVLKAHLLNPA